MPDNIFCQRLYEISWHRVQLKMQNTRNVLARQHPLSIFHAIFLSAAKGSRINRKEFFFHPADGSLEQRVRRDEIYDLELIFPASRLDHIEEYCNSLAEHLKDQRNNFSLLQINPPEKRDLYLLEKEWGTINSEKDEICLDFMTPFPFNPEDKKRRWMIDGDQFFRQLDNRIKRFYNIKISSEAWSEVRLLPYYWTYKNIKHKSHSNPGEQYINGMVGPLYIRGEIKLVLPLLMVCSELHGGRRTGNGQGYYRIRPNQPFFDQQIDDLSRFQDYVKKLDQESDITDKIAETFVNQATGIEKLQQNIADGYHRQQPANGFYIDKRRSGKRLIVTLELEDLLVHKFIASLLTPVMDRMFEDAAVGFRPGRSREDARKMIRRACGEGYCYVLESDIATFFDRIDWQILEQKLDECLPRQDLKLRDILKKIVRLPLKMAGEPFPRSRGLLQGSPLSPLLANLYLDSFDEEMEKLGYLMVRYGDDFLVMTRSREEAEQALKVIRELLAPLKLLLKEEKTGTTPVDLGFSFLGIDFDVGMDEDYVADSTLGKTLYVRHQYAFIGLDSDALIINKNKILQARLPLKRIAEIVVLGTNTVSSRLLGRCAKDKIPVSFCSPTGYYFSTLRPDSKRSLQVTGDHQITFNQLTEAEKTKIAARIVTAKLHNYLAWFKQRWPAEARKLSRDVESNIASLVKADSINKIRGYEGASARQIFHFVNSLCKNHDFHSKGRRKRERRDRFNSLLDFAYSLLFTRLNVLLRSRGLNPYLGILHSHKDNYESLVCDLQEPFRCRMDRFVIKTVNRGIIKPEDFTEESFKNSDKQRFSLISPAIGLFLEAYERELDTKLAGDNGTLKQLLHAQVRSLSDWVKNRERLDFYRTEADGRDLWISNPGKI